MGKRLKCPKCNTTFTATVAASIASPRAAEKVPRLHMSRGVLVFLIILVTIPSLLAFWNFGPGRVRAKWEKIADAAADDVKEVVTRGIQGHLSAEGWFNPAKTHRAPEAMSVGFLLSPMYLTMPEKIGFAGASTEGAFVGRYYPETGEVEVDVELGGASLQGVGVVRRGTTKIHVTGRNRGGKFTVEVNGKPSEVIWRE